MDTNELIKSLVQELKPVTPIEPVNRRIVRWGMAGVLVLGLGFFITGVRENLQEQLSTPGFFLESLVLLVLALVAVSGAITLSVPGRTFKRLNGLLIGLMGFWVGRQVFLLGERYNALGAAAFQPGMHLTCAFIIFIMGGALIWPLFRTLQQAAPLNPKLCGALAGLASGSLAAFAMQWVCIHDHPAHVFLWHMGAVATFVATGLWLGQRTLGRFHRKDKQGE